MIEIGWVAAGVVLLPLIGAMTAEAAPDPERVKEIAAMLPAAPAGPGRPIADRTAWDALAALPAFTKLVPQAVEAAARPIAELPDELYLEFSRNGIRKNWQAVAFKRRADLALLVLAECAENRGRFLAPIGNLLRALCAEKTWVMPAHDAALTNFKQTQVTIDLASSALAWQMACADRLLGEKLSPETRALMRERVRHFVLAPYLDMLQGRAKEIWWMRTTNNWNAVCLAGVTGAALALVEPAEERALFVASAEELSKHFLAGFTPDGYRSEGVGYWNYGFGHYVLLAETVRQATGGKLDLLARPEAAAPARFGPAIEIVNGVYPAFADCPVDARPDPFLAAFLSRRFRMGLAAWEKTDLRSPHGTLNAPHRTLQETLLHAFPNAASETPPAPPSSGPGLRTFFKDAQVLVCRPASQNASSFAVALKGGHNNEHHNHNDLGSYVVVAGKVPLIADPGAEEYTARTFGPRRYESGVLNSFGHSVPMVAGQLQKAGKEAAAKIVRTEFTAAADTIVLDLKAAYDVPDLETLERTFVYSRADGGSLTVTDRVVFRTPRSFGAAVVTFADHRRPNPGEIILSKDGEALTIAVSAGGDRVTIRPENIPDGRKPTRLGIDFTQSVRQATLRLEIRPTPKGK